MPSKSILTKLLCTDCGHEFAIKCVVSRNYSKWTCRSCSIKKKWATKEYRENRPQKKKPERAKAGSPEHRLKLSRSLTGRKLSEPHKANISSAVKSKWRDPKYRKITTVGIHDSNESRAEKSRSLWLDDEFRKKYQTDEFKQKMAAVTTALWEDHDYRHKILQAKSTLEHKKLMRAIQQDPAYIAKLSAACNKLPRVSSIQRTLYQLLDDLGVEYYGENSEDKHRCMIGPWSFDCVIPIDGKKLLIECQGDWIHSLPHKRIADRAKATYIDKYFSATHELKYLWEHQFASYNGVLESLKSWLGLKRQELIDFKFSDCTIRKCSADEYRPFLQAYHYLANAGRGGIAHGCYLGEKLIAVCVFSPLPRQNIIINNLSGKDVRDLSRLCIHPSYQRKNFGSWFISRCIKRLNGVKLVVAYADQTFNHNGDVYKASNFVFDGYTSAEYWYASDDGWVMHKKTLYNKARNLNLSESEYSERFKLRKVHGLKKLRFIFEI